ncbi:MAG: RecX family transcriptional regulator [Saprospiraceae bacterium]|nr:RecX family transcriptional regulator [Saprospiraceae bacterium]
MKNKFISTSEALQKLQHYCAYQERCHQEVRQKLLDLGVYGDRLEEVMVALIEDNFLNEERFARTFARGKFEFKNWGKIKIVQELKKRHITSYCIQKGLEEIENSQYETKLYVLIAKKSATLEYENEYERKAKLAAYALQKGFESEKVWETVQRFLHEGNTP